MFSFGLSMLCCLVLVAALQTGCPRSNALCLKLVRETKVGGIVMEAQVRISTVELRKKNFLFVARRLNVRRKFVICLKPDT
jgi:hypothetical protein